MIHLQRKVPFITIIGGLVIVLFLTTVPTYRDNGDRLLAAFCLVTLVPVGFLELKRRRERLEHIQQMYNSIDPNRGRGMVPLPGFVPPKPRPRKIGYGSAMRR